MRSSKTIKLFITIYMNFSLYLPIGPPQRSQQDILTRRSATYNNDELYQVSRSGAHNTVRHCYLPLPARPPAV